MAMSGMGMMTLLMAMLSGGAAELLDFVPTEAYWKAKGVTVTTEQLIADVTPVKGKDASKLIVALGSGTPGERDAAMAGILRIGPAALPQLEKMKDDTDLEIANRVGALIQQIRVSGKATAVRTLMAIRTMGERKRPEAVPALAALLASKEPFVAEYAARAIAAIEGKPAPARASLAAGLKADLAVLPANVGVVAQVAGMAGRRVSIDDAIKQLPPGQDANDAVAQLTAGAIMVAEQVGNLRIDGITFALSDDVGDQDKGFVVVVLRGEFDAAAARGALGRAGAAAETVAGAEVYGIPNAPFRMLFPSDDRAVVVGGAPGQDAAVLKDLIAALQTGKGGLATNAAIAKLIAGVNPKAGGWAVVNVTDAYRKSDVVGAFDSVTAHATAADGKTTIDVKGVGTDARKVAAAVGQVNAGVDQARQVLPQIAGQMPALKPIAEFVAGMKCEANGAAATLTGEFKGDAGALFMLPMMGMGMAVQGGRAAEAPIAPPAVVRENVPADPAPKP